MTPTNRVTAQRLPSVQFIVHGDPAPQSGMKPRGRHANGSVRLVSTGGVNLQSWRDQMAITARNSATEHRVCFGEPVLVQANFRFAMPKSRPKWMRDQGTECRAANIDQPVGIYAGMSAKARRDIRREGQVA